MLTAYASATLVIPHGHTGELPDEEAARYIEKGLAEPVATPGSTPEPPASVPEPPSEGSETPANGPETPSVAPETQSAQSSKASGRVSRRKGN